MQKIAAIQAKERNPSRRILLEPLTEDRRLSSESSRVMMQVSRHRAQPGPLSQSRVLGAFYQWDGAVGLPDLPIDIIESWDWGQRRGFTEKSLLVSCFGGGQDSMNLYRNCTVPICETVALPPVSKSGICQ